MGQKSKQLCLPNSFLTCRKYVNTHQFRISGEKYCHTKQNAIGSLQYALCLTYRLYLGVLKSLLDFLCHLASYFHYFHDAQLGARGKSGTLGWKWSFSNLLQMFHILQQPLPWSFQFLNEQFYIVQNRFYGYLNMTFVITQFTYMSNFQ